MVVHEHGALAPPNQLSLPHTFSILSLLSCAEGHRGDVDYMDERLCVVSLLSKSFFWSSDINTTFTPTYVNACLTTILESMLMGMLGWLGHTSITALLTSAMVNNKGCRQMCCKPLLTSWVVAAPSGTLCRACSWEGLAGQ